jgi:hypothetical protein
LEGVFDMSLEGDFQQHKVTPNLEFLFTFGMSWEGVGGELSNRRELVVTIIFLKKAPSNLGMRTL